MKKYSVEVFFDKFDMIREFDKQPSTQDYSEKTEVMQIIAKDLEEVRRRVKSEYPVARYLHLIDIDDVGV